MKDESYIVKMKRLDEMLQDGDITEDTYLYLTRELYYDSFACEEPSKADINKEIP